MVFLFCVALVIHSLCFGALIPIEIENETIIKLSSAAFKKLKDDSKLMSHCGNDYDQINRWYLPISLTQGVVLKEYLENNTIYTTHSGLKEIMHIADKLEMRELLHKSATSFADIITKPEAWKKLLQYQQSVSDLATTPILDAVLTQKIKKEPIMQIALASTLGHVSTTNSAISTPLFDEYALLQKQLNAFYTVTVGPHCVIPDQPYQPLVAVAIGKSLRIWHREKNKEISRQVVHTTPITALCTTPDGLYIISGAQNGNIKIWNRSTGQLERALPFHTTAIQCLASNGILIVSSCKNKNIAIWDRNSSKCHKIFQRPYEFKSITIDDDATIVGRSSNFIDVWRPELSLNSYKDVLDFLEEQFLPKP